LNLPSDGKEKLNLHTHVHAHPHGTYPHKHAQDPKLFPRLHSDKEAPSGQQARRLIISVSGVPPFAFQATEDKQPSRRPKKKAGLIKIEIPTRQMTNVELRNSFYFIC
jgi:hypothetical protein